MPAQPRSTNLQGTQGEESGRGFGQQPHQSPCAGHGPQEIPPNRGNRHRQSLSEP